MRIQLHPTVAAFSLLGLAVAAPANAATVNVTNCNDTGSGSLRSAAASALRGDVIDLRGLACTRILLTSGPIIFNQRTITLQGPGQTRLAIDGGRRSGVLRHQAFDGRFLVRDLTVRGGRIDERDAVGGCVVGGNVELERVSVHDCVAHGSFTAFGGGVAGRNSLRLTSSVVYASRAVVDEFGYGSFGGGAYSGRWLTLDHSLLCHNEAASGGGGWSADTLTARYSTVRHNVGGGAQALAGTVERSTFSHNVGAGLEIGVAINSFSEVVNSTFSSNRGSGLVAGGDSLLLQNTIAYNTVSRDGSTCPGGLDLAAGGVQMRGNLVAHNTCDGIPLDFTRGPETNFVLPSDGNLIMYAAAPVPEGTLSSDPNLLPLANNGGPTLTHALPANSPAIDAGSEDENARPYDQRGTGFRRTVGGGADIGAFERQQP